MAQNRPYVYDPSQQIRKDLGGAADSVAQGFQNVLDSKILGYNTAKKQFEDIELLKKDLSIHDNEVITKRANDLLGKTAGMIKEKGKVDFSNLGEIRQEIRAIGDAKRNSALKAKAIEEATGMVLKNAGSITDVYGTITKMNSLLKDPGKLFSPKDITSDIMAVYRDGLNVNKIIDDRLTDYLESRTGGQPEVYNNERGDVLVSNYKTIPGFTFSKNQYVPNEIDDGKGNKIDPFEQLMSTVLTPDIIELYQEKIGPATTLDSVKNLLKNHIGQVLNSKVETQVKALSEDVERKKSLTDATKAKMVKDVDMLKIAWEKLAVAKRNATTQEERTSIMRQMNSIKEQGMMYDNQLKEFKATNPTEYMNIFGSKSEVNDIFKEDPVPSNPGTPKPLPKPNNGKVPVTNKPFKAKTTTGGR
jgi:hypothetical protein